MSTNYDEEILNLELQYQLESQKNALTKNKLEILRLRKRVDDYENTNISLEEEIKKTQERISEIKEVRKNG